MFAVSLNGWILAAHLFGAFALVGGLTAFIVATVAARRIADPQQALALGRIVGSGTVALRAGLVAVVVFGLWLVFSVKGYAISNGWIAAALILWLVVGALGDRSVVVSRRATELARTLSSSGQEGPNDDLGRALRSHAALVLRTGAALAAIAILVLMIWKPGA